MLKEFKEFAMRGNVVDLAIGVIIGAAFGKIVDSLVNDIIMPFIGAVGGADFSNYFFGLSSKVVASNLADAKKQGPVFAYGNFITVAVNFLIIAFVLFLVVKGINMLKQARSRRPRGARAAERRSRSAHANSRLARQTLIPKRSEASLRAASRFSGRRRSPSCGRRLLSFMTRRWTRSSPRKRRRLATGSRKFSPPRAPSS